MTSVVPIASMQPLTHILFDFFGTLVAYSESRIEQGYDQSYALVVNNGADVTYATFLTEWDRLFSEFERRSTISHDEFSMTELCASFLRRMFGKPASSKLIAAFRDTYLAEWSRGVTDIAGVNKMLGDLAAHYTLVLVSNTHHAPLIHGHLRRSRMAPYFRRVITSIEFGKRKPSPLIFEHALRAAEGHKETALFVGDSYVADYEGARAAGLACLLIDPALQYDIPSSQRLIGIHDLPSVLLSVSEVMYVSRS